MGLAVLDAVLSKSSATKNVGGAISGAGSLVRRFLDPAVPALSAKPTNPPSSPSSGGSGALGPTGVTPLSTQPAGTTIANLPAGTPVTTL